MFYDILFVLFRYFNCIYTIYFGNTLASTGMIRFYKEESTQLIIVGVTNTKWLYRLGRVTHLLKETMIYTKLNTIHSGLDGSGDQHDLISLVEDIGPRMNQP